MFARWTFHANYAAVEVKSLTVMVECKHARDVQDPPSGYDGKGQFLLETAHDADRAGRH